MPRRTHIPAVIQCALCDRDREHYARGLCISCWNYANRVGLLDQFPKLAFGRRS